MSKNRGASRTNKRGITAGTIVVGVILLLFLASLVVNSGFLRRHVTAVEIDGTEFTSAEYQYFYVGTINEYTNQVYSNYSSMASSLLPDNTIPLSEQTNMLTGQTWDVFYDESTMEKMKFFAGAMKEAKAAGFTVSEDEYAVVEEQLTELEAQIKEYYDMSLSRYFKNQYGARSGVNVSLYKEMTRQQHYVSLYAQRINDALEYTQDELDAKYAEKKDDYDYFEYRYFTVKADMPVLEDFDTTEEFDQARADAVVAASELANSYASTIADEQGFIDAAREYDATAYGSEDSTLSINQGSQFSTTYGDWLKDSARKAGDIASMPLSEDEETNESFYVVYFKERHVNDYPSANIQLLSISANALSSTDYTDENGEMDEDAYNAAVEASYAAVEAEAEELYADWQAAGGMQEYLADLLENHSHEEEQEFTHAVGGGFYENVRNSYDDTDVANDWIYGEQHKDGDTTLLKIKDGTWYIIYFAGYDMDYCDYLADLDLRNEHMTSWEEGFFEKEAVFKWGMRLI